MAQQTLQALGRAVQLHPVLVFLFVFAGPIAWAYWRFALAPYRQERRQDLLSPWLGAQPAVPAVLEHYAAWEWASESRLTPFGRWLLEELERRHRSLAEVSRDAGVQMDALLSVLYSGTGRRIDPDMIHTLASVLGAGRHQIERLEQAELAAGAEAGKRR